MENGFYMQAFDKLCILMPICSKWDTKLLSYQGLNISKLLLLVPHFEY